MAETGGNTGRNDTRNNAKSPLTRWILLGLGYFFVLLGILGLILPFLHGIMFLVIGFILLARTSPRFRLLRQRLRRRHPQWAARYDRYEGTAKDWMRRQRARLPRRRPSHQENRKT